MRGWGMIVGCLLLVGSLVWPLQAAKAQSNKLVVIVEENESFSDIVGNTSQAPYLNQLIANGKLFTNYTEASGNGSQPNYLAMTSGLTTPQTPPSPNIFQAIDGSGGALTWKEFMESMTGTCAGGTTGNVPGTSDTLYTADHDPDWFYRANTTCSTNDVPFTTSTFNPASLPNLSYVVPNECDDMHTLPTNGQACPAYFGSNPGTSQINIGDNWLATVVPSLLAQSNVTVLITWDEGRVGNHIPTLEVGAGVTPGSTDGNAYNHFNLEAGLYSYFGRGTAPNNGATATPLPIGAPASGTAPTVSSFTPTSGPSGTSVTITGTNFTGATAVKFGGTTATFTVNSDTQITATVPTGATTGPIAVTTPAGTGTSTASFTVTAAPTISSFTPTSGPAGTSVTITGSAFTGATAVKFGGTTATFTVNSDTQITATVPTGATTGPIAVTTPAGTGTSTASFTVTTAPGAPTVSSFTPTSGPSGTSVTITGTNFTGATAVKFGGTTATFTVNSDTQITATVPTGATTGPIAVTTPAGTGTSTASFTVTTAPGAPTVSSFTPTSGPSGTSVTITGSAFTGATAVKFGGTTATFTVNSDTQITATVPTGATTGPIAVTTPAGTGTSTASFTVTQSGAPMTVTLTGPTGSPNGTSLKVFVVTGATEAGGASNANEVTSGTAATWSLTPNSSNSLLLDVIYDETGGSSGECTAASGNTLVDNTSQHDAFCDGYYSGTVTAGTPVTLGASAPTADKKDWASYEVRPSGGSAPSRDASTPAVVTSASNTVTTASFTPPAGAVLVALGTTNVWSSSAPTITDSSGLTWTRRAWFAGGGGMTVLYTATVP